MKSVITNLNISHYSFKKIKAQDIILKTCADNSDCPDGVCWNMD